MLSEEQYLVSPEPKVLGSTFGMKKPSYAKRRLRGEQSSQKMQPEMIRDCLAGNTRGEHAVAIS
jgi:hypothetical protein